MDYDIVSRKLIGSDYKLTLKSSVRTLNFDVGGSSDCIYLLWLLLCVHKKVVSFIDSAQEERVYTGSSRISVTISILSNVVSVALTKSLTNLFTMIRVLYGIQC